MNNESTTSAILAIAQAIKGMNGRIVTDNGLTSVACTSTSWQDSGWSLVLPEAGTWLLVYQVRFQNQTTVAGLYLRAKLYDKNISSDVPNSLRVGSYNGGTGTSIENTTWVTPYVTSEDDTEIAIYYQRSAASGWTYSQMNYDTNGHSQLVAIKIK